MFKVLFKNHVGKIAYVLGTYESEDKAEKALIDEMNDWSSKKQEALTPEIEEV